MREKNSTAKNIHLNSYIESCIQKYELKLNG